MVYAYNDLCDRRKLWLELDHVNTQWIEIGLGQPWCITGDFNYFLSASDTNGPPSLNFRIISEFRDRVRQSGTMSLWFKSVWGKYLVPKFAFTV